jgi:ABC-2 type transport system ATP-binding protein
MAAEGTPASLKAEVGVPHLELSLAEGAREAAERILAEFGRVLPARNGTLQVALDQGPGVVARIVVALDGQGLVVDSLDVVEPTLDDVFVEKTGRHLEGADPAA